MTDGEETFKSRVQEFWRWFAEAASRYSETIAAVACATLTTEISAKVNALADGLAWEFGPGAGGGGHSLTLSGEGNLHRQMLTIYWLEKSTDRRRTRCRSQGFRQRPFVRRREWNSERVYRPAAVRRFQQH